MIKLVIFDLDGTLIDTVDDLGRTCDYLLERSGIKPNWTRNDYRSFVGNGAKKLIERAFPYKLSSDELDEQYQLFKVKYEEIKLENAYAYEGVKDLVYSLKKNGLELSVCSNKPDGAAREMIDSVFGENIFDFVCGAQDNGPVKPDVTRLNKILVKQGINPDECIWVGDSDVDIKSSRNLGCEVIGVTWGFCPRDVILEENPDYTADKAEDVLKIITDKLNC